MSKATDDVLAERARQISEEGWSETHDDEHEAGELATAGACYAANAACVLHPLNGTPFDEAPSNWPWDDEWWKPSTPRRDLVKAAALLIAEIERIDRASRIDSGQ